MSQNFDDYPGFQQIPGMPILLQQSEYLLSSHLYRQIDTLFVKSSVNLLFYIALDKCAHANEINHACFHA